jgi:K+-transporting ATPase ATPase C chain
MQMRQIKTSIMAILVFTLLCGIAYPLAMTVIARAAFPGLSQGSLITNNGEPAGSALIGQAFTQAGHFRGRPSATDPEYNARGSAASNAGPSNAKFIAQVRERADRVREKYGLAPDAKIPADLVTASASGLDPHISVDAALLQAALIARERNMDVAEIERLVRLHTEAPLFGFWGNERVNVLLLNKELDSAARDGHD